MPIDDVANEYGAVGFPFRSDLAHMLAILIEISWAVEVPDDEDSCHQAGSRTHSAMLTPVSLPNPAAVNFRIGADTTYAGVIAPIEVSSPLKSVPLMDFLRVVFAWFADTHRLDASPTGR
tara:strand:- start:6626 stop:6985 length:360 start_codon:yes stop_codon:yes gene_type:complete